MADAQGIAVVFEELASNEYIFDPSGIGQTTGSGTWSRSGNEITWGGDDPSITKTTTGSTDVTALRVRTSGTFTSTGQLICDIDHSESPVTLSEGDTIIYTSIKVNFTT